MKALRKLPWWQHLTLPAYSRQQRVALIVVTGALAIR
jgi:hypothetical protein